MYMRTKFSGSDIAGAIMLYSGGPNIIIWDNYGSLYLIENIHGFRFKGSIKEVKGSIKKVCPYGTSSIFILRPDSEFVNDRMYNEILTCIEDLYGMTIEEFSLGQLEYM